MFEYMRLKKTVHEPNRSIAHIVLAFAYLTIVISYTFVDRSPNVKTERYQLPAKKRAQKQYSTLAAFVPRRSAPSRGLSLS